MTRPALPLLAPSALFVVLLLLLLASGGNEALFLWLNHQSQRLPAALWANLTLLADAAMGFALMSLFLKRHAKQVFWAIIGGVVCAVLVNLAKSGFAVARPPAVLSPDAFVNIGPRLRSGSFPSGHTTTAFYLAALLASARIGRGWTALCLTGAIVLGLSRIAVGVHWPADVLAGATIGWTVGVLTMRFAARAAPAGLAKRLFAAAICLTGSLYLFWLESGLPDVAALQLTTATVCTAIGLLAIAAERRRVAARRG